VFEVFIIRPFDVLSLMLRSLTPEPHARVVVEALNQWILGFSDTRLCLNCDAEFVSASDPDAFMVVLPFADFDSAVVAGICETCAVGDLNEITLLRMRQPWPDLHVKEGGIA
jgi:hypothetical protein